MFKRFILIIILFLININPINANIDIKARTAILQDYLSGEILYEKEPNRSIYPASMTKIMTSIIAFDLLRSGDLNLDEKFIISEKAWRLSTSGYSSMFVMVGDEVSVENLLRGIIVASGNDACIALAEGIAGTEEEFAIMMTSKAQELGMFDTNFANSSGINDPDNYSTVKDIMIMSNYLIKEHPDYYKWFSEKEFTWDRTGGDPITQGNRNPLLYKNLGADGIKSSYSTTDPSIWVSGTGGEYGINQDYWGSDTRTYLFEPAIMTTDQSSCDVGYVSQYTSNRNAFNDSSNPHPDNPECKYTSRFNGTSSAAPSVAGAIAVLLEAYPDLTWREVKHVIANSARKVDEDRGTLCNWSCNFNFNGRIYSKQKIN